MLLCSAINKENAMKIGFDGKRAAQNFTGLGNYSRYALEAMLAGYPAEEYSVYIPKDVDNGKFDAILSTSCGAMKKVLPVGWFAKKFKSLWRVWGVTADLCRDKVDIYHGLSNELPLTIRRAWPQVKSVVTIHDLIFLKCPGCYPVIDRNIYNYKFRKACFHALLDGLTAHACQFCKLRNRQIFLFRFCHGCTVLSIHQQTLLLRCPGRCENTWKCIDHLPGFHI